MSLTADELRNKIRLVNEIENTKKQIKNNYLSDVIANSGFADYTTRLFHPVITSQSEQINKLDKLQGERMKKLEDNQQLMIEGIGDKLGVAWKQDSSENVGRRERAAPTSLVEYYVSSRDKGLTYGLELNGDTFMIGNHNASFSEGSSGTTLHVGDYVYDATPGLHHLLTRNTKPSNDGVVTKDDVTTYLQLTIDCGINVRNNSDKYKLLKDEYGWMKYKNEWMKVKDYDRLVAIKEAKRAKNRAEKDRLEAERVRLEAERARIVAESEGSGLMPSNPNSLLEMLGYRLGSYQAGNHGLRNEIIDIADELYRQKAINTLQYKHINKVIANGGKKKIR